MFISVLGIVIKCIDGNWCELSHPNILGEMVAVGGTELLFEVGELIKIYKGKGREKHDT